MIEPKSQDFAANPPAIAFAVPAIMCGIALLHLPYGYYMLLRLVVCACAAWIVAVRYQEERWTWVAIFGLLALAYNPIFRVHLTREIWSVINVATIVLFVAGWQAGRKAVATPHDGLRRK